MFRTTHTARRIATAIVAGLTLMAVASSVAVAGVDRPDGYQPQLQAAAEPDVFERYVANHRQDTDANVVSYLSHGILSSSAPSGAALRETPDGFQPQLSSDRIVLGSERRLDRRDWGLMGGAALAAILVALAAMQFAGRNRGRLKNA